MSTVAILDCDNVCGHEQDRKNLNHNDESWRKRILEAVLTNATTIIPSSQPMVRSTKIFEYSRIVTRMVEVTVKTTISAISPGPRFWSGADCKESIVLKKLRMPIRGSVKGPVIRILLHTWRMNRSRLIVSWYIFANRKAGRQKWRTRHTVKSRSATREKPLYSYNSTSMAEKWIAATDFTKLWGWSAAIYTFQLLENVRETSLDSSHIFADLSLEC